MKQIALSLFVIAASGTYVWNQPGGNPASDMLDSALPADAAEADCLKPKIPGLGAAVRGMIAQPAPFEPTFRTRFKIDNAETAGISVPLQWLAFPKVLPPAHPAPPPPSLISPEKVAIPVIADDGSRAPSFATPAVYVPVPQPRPALPDSVMRFTNAKMKLAASGYADGVYTGPAADAYYGIIQLQALVQGGRLTALKVLQYPSDRRTSIRINRQALPILRDEAISAQSANVDIVSGATLTSRAFIQSLRWRVEESIVIAHARDADSDGHAYHG